MPKHDQRKGQWLINKIRFNNPKYDGVLHSKSNPLSIDEYGKAIEGIIWNMRNDEFDGYMREYNE